MQDNEKEKGGEWISRSEYARRQLDEHMNQLRKAAQRGLRELTHVYVPKPRNAEPTPPKPYIDDNDPAPESTPPKPYIDDAGKWHGSTKALAILLRSNYRQNELGTIDKMLRCAAKGFGVGFELLRAEYYRKANFPNGKNPMPDTLTMQIFKILNGCEK